jgi:anti-sigma B factor antagonist
VPHSNHGDGRLTSTSRDSTFPTRHDGGSREPRLDLGCLPGEQLSITTRWIGRRAVIAIAGELDIATQPQLDHALDAAIDGGALQVWVDLAELDFIDSSGLHSLLAASARLHALRRGLAVICTADGAVRRTFRVAGLEGRLPLYASRAEARQKS